MELTLAIAALKVVGYGLAAIGPGIGIGIATYGLCVSAARQPEMPVRNPPFNDMKMKIVKLLMR